jgi:hypothetical protein
LITAESPTSRRLRRGRLIQFPQLTMPLIAALTPREHEVSHTDEIVEPVRYDAPADIVGSPRRRRLPSRPTTSPVAFAAAACPS